MYEILLKLIDKEGLSPDWLLFINENFSEEQLNTLKFILNSFPENLLIKNGFPFDDTINIIVLLAYDIGASRELINNLQISKSSDELYNSIVSQSNLSENNKTLLVLLVSEIDTVLLDQSIDEKKAIIINYRHLISMLPNIIKNKGTISNIINIIKAFLLDRNLTIDFSVDMIDHKPTITINNTFISYDPESLPLGKNYIYSDNIEVTSGPTDPPAFRIIDPFIIKANTEYTFQIERSYVDTPYFSLTFYYYYNEIDYDEESILRTSMSFDFLTNIYYYSFTPPVGTTHFSFACVHNNEYYIEGEELVGIQLEEGSSYTTYEPYVAFYPLQDIVDYGASADDPITPPSSAPYKYYLSKDSILYRFLDSSRAAGIPCNVVLHSTIEPKSIIIPVLTMSLISVDYINSTYTVNITNESSANVTAYIGDYETVVPYDPLVNLGNTTSLSLLANESKNVTRLADYSNFNIHGALTTIEAYSVYGESQSDPVHIDHITNNPAPALELTLNSDDVTVSKGNVNLVGGYARVKVYNSNSVSVTAVISVTFDGRTSTRNKIVQANSYSSNQDFPNPRYSTQTAEITVTLIKTGYISSSSIYKEVTGVWPKYQDGLEEL